MLGSVVCRIMELLTGRHPELHLVPAVVNSAGARDWVATLADPVNHTGNLDAPSSAAGELSSRI